MATETRRIEFNFASRGARDVQRDIEQVGNQADDTSGQLEATGGRGGKAMGALSAGIGKATGALAALGLGLGTVSAAISKGLDAQDATAKMQAQLGLTKEQAGRIGSEAGKIYSQAYGESMDEVKGAITSVIRNMDGMRDASSADLQVTTKRAMDLATVMDEDVGRVTMSVSQMMRTGLAKSSQEAFDILTAGAQRGANKAEDLLDTFNEYGTQFRKLGLDGKTAMGLLSQGLQAGARDADIVADAMKEFSIRAIDGSETTAAGFKALGLNAKEMAAQIGRGGPAASKGLDMVLDRLRKIKDPVKRAQVAVMLFGTQAEDMGKALFKLDPSKAVKGLGQLKGATDRAGAAMGDTAKAKMTAFKRTLEVAVMNFIGAKVIPAFEKLGQAVQDWAKSKEGQKTLKQIGDTVRRVGTWIRVELVPVLKDVAKIIAEKVVPQVVRFHKVVIGELFKSIKRLAAELQKSGVDWKTNAKRIAEVVGVIAQKLGPIITWLYKNVLKGLVSTLIAVIRTEIKVYNSIKTLIDWFTKAGKTIAGWGKAVGRAIGTFKDVSVKSFLYVARIFLDMVSKLVTGAAKAFGWVPGLGKKLKSARDAVNGFKNQVNADIAKITAGKTVTIKVKALAGGVVDAGSSVARGALGFAKGGPVPFWGPDATTARDSVPSLLIPDEHVVTRDEVKGAGGHGAVMRIRRAMKAGLLKGYADGGPVGMDVRAAVDNPHRTLQTVGNGIGNILVKFAQKLAKLFGGANGVVREARKWIGLPYSWGGGGAGGPGYGIGRGAGTFGFDCSGLSQRAWWAGGKTMIPRVTTGQIAASKSIGSPRAGALGFPHPGHVVIATGKGTIVQAPFTGSHVQEVPISRHYDWRWPNNAKFATGGPVKMPTFRDRPHEAHLKHLAHLRHVRHMRHLAHLKHRKDWLGPLEGRVERGRSRPIEKMPTFGPKKMHAFAAGGEVKKLGAMVAGGLATMSEVRLARQLGIAGRARGGPVLAGTPYVVGENGPEIMVPRGPGTVHPTGTTIIYQTNHWTVNVPLGASKGAVGREVAEALDHYGAQGGTLKKIRVVRT